MPTAPATGILDAIDTRDSISIRGDGAIVYDSRWERRALATGIDVPRFLSVVGDYVSDDGTVDWRSVYADWGEMTL